MNTTRIILTGMFFALLGISLQGKAEDIDLYSKPAGAINNPNVLIILDTASNANASVTNACTYADGSGAPSIGNSLLGIEQCTLFNLVYNLPVNSVNLGLMFYNASGLTCVGGSGTNSAGGCLVQKLQPLTTTYKTTLETWIKGWKTGAGGITSNGEATGQTMQEAWAYFAGNTGVSGRNYSNVAPSPGCQKNFVIYIANAYDTNGTPGDGGLGTYSMTTGAPTPPPPGINNAPGVPTSPTPSTIYIPSGTYNTCGSYTMPNHGNSSGLYADEWARYMHQYNLYPKLVGSTNITTYTIAALGPSCKPDYPALLSSMANYGGGKYFPTYTPGDMSQALLRILNEVQAVNSVFASSSLPVSVNTQGTYLNQVYMGMFRPDPAANPRWLGNLKQYQFIYNSTTQVLQLGDAVGMPAISAAGTGFLDPSAVSFWTCTSTANPKSALAPYAQTTTPPAYSPYCNTPLADPANGFYANNSNGVGGAYDLPDGDVVEKGGTAQMLRLVNLTDDYTQLPYSSTNTTSTNLRQLYTWCPSGAGCVNTLSDSTNAFDSSNTAITDAMLGTGPIAISSITSAATVSAGGLTPASSTGTVSTVSITNLAKSGNTVTATVSATDLAKLSVGSQIQVASGAAKYDCNPCSVTSVNPGAGATPSTFTYSNPGGGGAPALPTTATIYTNFATIGATGLAVGQTVTFSSCAIYNNAINGQLNGTIGTVIATSPSVTLAVATALVPPAAPATSTDSGCNYTPNTANVTTTANHNFPTGALISIAGASATSPWVTCSSTTCYNGTWQIKVTGANTFSYQYTVPGPLSNSGAGATATNTTTTRDLLLKWVRGQDNLGDEASLCPPGVAAGTGNCPSPAVTIRPSIHGDVLHSRPAVINYGGVTINISSTSDSGTTRTATAPAADVANLGAVGTTATVIFANGNTCTVTVASSTTFTYSIYGCGATGAQLAATGTPNVVVYYGANDGVFHAVNGNQPLNDPNAGHELWGFIPTEFVGNFLRLHDNSPSWWVPSTLPGIIPAPQRKTYFADGSTGVYHLVGGNGKTITAYIYLSMRRGGRFIYALDVTTPSNPTFLWEHSNADPGFSELGQTWSRPKVYKVSGYANPVLIFGAGYDPAEDQEAPGTDTMGRGIFIVDAITGNLVWSASPTGSTSCSVGTTPPCHVVVPNMKYSIPADITALDKDLDGQADRLYAVDTGGNVWRIDLEPGGLGGMTPDFWQVEQFAALGCNTGTCAAGTVPRKFFYPAEVISTSTYDAIFVGSGDREHPLYTDPKSTSTNPLPYPGSPPYNVSAFQVVNRVYMLQDMTTGYNGIGKTVITESNLYNCASCSATSPYPPGYSGYYITMQTGEKIVNAPTAVAGNVYFGTNTVEPPSNQVCDEGLGEATGYKLSPFTGALSSGEYESGGFPPTAVAGVVWVRDSVTGKMMQVLFCQGCGGTEDSPRNSPLQGGKPPLKTSPARKRTYWYQENK